MGQYLSCCGWCDHVGCVGGKESAGGRSCIVFTDFIFIIIALITSAIGLSGFSSSSSVITGVGAWSKVSGDKGSVYSNLWGVAFKPTGISQCEYYVSCPVAGRTCVYPPVRIDLCGTLSWDELEDNFNDANSSLTLGNYTLGSNAKDCKDASNGVKVSAILSVVIAVIMLTTRCICNNRMEYDTDKRKKCMILFSLVMPMLTTAAAAVQYSTGCVSKINDDIDSLQGTAWEAIFGDDHAKVMSCYILFCVSLACYVGSFGLHLCLKGNSGNGQDNDVTFEAPHGKV